MAEELTSEERNWLGESCRDGLEHKCLRMLDERDARIARLTEAMITSERDWKKDVEAMTVSETIRAEAAEAELQELKVESMRDRHVLTEAKANLQQRLVIANSLLEDTAALSYCPTWLKKAIRDYFQT